MCTLTSLQLHSPIDLFANYLLTNRSGIIIGFTRPIDEFMNINSETLINQELNIKEYCVGLEGEEFESLEGFRKLGFSVINQSNTNNNSQRKGLKAHLNSKTNSNSISNKDKQPTFKSLRKCQITNNNYPEADLFIKVFKLPQLNIKNNSYPNGLNRIKTGTITNKILSHIPNPTNLPNPPSVSFNLNSLDSKQPMENKFKRSKNSSKNLNITNSQFTTLGRNDVSKLQETTAIIQNNTRDPLKIRENIEAHEFNSEINYNSLQIQSSIRAL